MKPRQTLRKLFSSNPILLGFSFLLAFGIWLGVQVGLAPEEERTLSIPVTIEITSAVENLNLEAFTPAEGIYVDVTVKAKRYVLNEITPEQITVRAQTSAVGASGVRSLRLAATGAMGRDFEIVRLSQQEINVLFDERREQEFPLEPVLVGESGKKLKNRQDAAPDGYIVDYELLSASTVTLSGPSAEIARIKSITATAQLTEPLTDTTAFTTAIALQTDGDSPLQFVSVLTEEVTMTVPVYKSVILPVEVEWLNAPTAYTDKPLVYACNPKKAEFGISESILNEIKSVTVGVVDFSKLPAGKKTELIFPAAEVRQYKLLSKEESFKVTVDTTSQRSGEFAVPHSNIQMINAPEGIIAQAVAGSLDVVTVAGSSKSIKKLDSSDIYAEVDLADTDAKNSKITLPVRVFVKGYDDCWVIGEHKITLEITPEE